MVNREVALVVEVLGIILVVCAIILELIYEADLYLGLITVGSLVFAVGSAIYAKIVKGG